jgi:hypothetical protein
VLANTNNYGTDASESVNMLPIPFHKIELLEIIVQSTTTISTASVCHASASRCLAQILDINNIFRDTKSNFNYKKINDNDSKLSYNDINVYETI